MRTTAIVGMAIVAITSMPASATIINIPDDYPTIQQGIDASTDGDTVLVQPGTYVENINFNGHNIVLGSMFLTTSDSQFISSTIIDGSLDENTVTFESNENDNTMLVGFTLTISDSTWFNRGIYCNDSDPIISYNIIRGFYYRSAGAGIKVGGNAAPQIVNNMIANNTSFDNFPHMGGGGIVCGGDSRPLIADNVIINNTSETGGGILCGGNSCPEITNNVIIDNFAAFFGGGIYGSSSCEFIIQGNIILDNRALTKGGGIYCRFSELLITDNVITNNEVLNWYPEVCFGGGIFLLDSNGKIENNLIHNNHSPFGGGIASRQSDFRIVNNCILGNTADSLGGAIICDEGSHLNVINSIIWSNIDPQDTTIYLADSSAVTITYSNIQSGWEGQGNIDVDPLFRDPENGDFHLMSTACGDPFDSPCIDAGHPDIIDSLLDCSWGLGTIFSDMGAYGGGDSVMVGIEFPDIRLPDESSLSQNYPNPFNAITVIQYSLPEPSGVIIEIYDILGRKVETLVNENQQAGYNQIVWDASDHSSGMYFYKIQAGDYSDTKKMVLLK